MHNQPTNQFNQMSAECPLRDAIHVLPHEQAPTPEPAPEPAPEPRAFPTWEDGMAFLMSIHEEIKEKKHALLNRRGESVGDICYV